MKLSKSSILVFVGLTLSFFQISGCSNSENQNELSLMINRLEFENDSLRDVVFERTHELNSNISPVVLMKNSFIQLGDSAEILTVIGVDAIPETSAKVLLGTGFKNQGVKNVYDTIICDGTVGKIQIYGDKIGNDTIYGVYILTKGDKTSTHPFKTVYEVIQ